MAAVVLQAAEAAGPKSNSRNGRPAYLETLHKAYFNSDNVAAALVDIGKLPRLEGAKEEAARSSANRLVYSVSGTLANTHCRDSGKCWSPTDGSRMWSHWRRNTRLIFQEGTAGAVGVFYNSGRKKRTDQRSDLGLVLADRIEFRVADTGRCDGHRVRREQAVPQVASHPGRSKPRSTIFRKELTARASCRCRCRCRQEMAERETGRDNRQRHARLLHSRKSTANHAVGAAPRRRQDRVEIKVPPFATPQVLEADRMIYGLPRPKISQDRGRHRWRDPARGACPCARRSRHRAGVLSPRACGAKLEGGDTGRRRQSGKGRR